MSFFIPAAYADTAAAGPAGSGFEWVFLIGFLVIFYLMIWRPQAKRAKEHKNLLGGLQKGNEVVTSGGIAGKVSKVTDDFVVIEVSDTVELKFQKQAIAATLPKGTLITADTYRPLEVYTVVALIYFALLFPSTLLAQAYERHLARKR